MNNKKIKIKKKRKGKGEKGTTREEGKKNTVFCWTW
jgi:hypothetical protein